MLFKDAIEQRNRLVFLCVDNPGITLGVANGGVPEQLAGRINVYTRSKTERCEAVPPRVKSDVLCDSGVLHPCAESLTVTPCQPGEHLVFRRGILRLLGQPFSGIHVQRQEQFDTGLVLDNLDLPMGCGLHYVFPTEAHDVIDAESAEAGEQERTLDVLSVTWGSDKPFDFLDRQILTLMLFDG